MRAQLIFESGAVIDVRPPESGDLPRQVSFGQERVIWFHLAGVVTHRLIVWPVGGVAVAAPDVAVYLEAPK